MDLKGYDYIQYSYNLAIWARICLKSIGERLLMIKKRFIAIGGWLNRGLLNILQKMSKSIFRIRYCLCMFLAFRSQNSCRIWPLSTWCNTTHTAMLLNWKHSTPESVTVIRSGAVEAPQLPKLHPQHLLPTGCSYAIRGYKHAPSSHDRRVLGV